MASERAFDSCGNADALPEIIRPTLRVAGRKNERGEPADERLTAKPVHIAGKARRFGQPAVDLMASRKSA